MSFGTNNGATNDVEKDVKCCPKNQFFDIESKKCKDIQEGKSYEPIDASVHHIAFDEAIETVLVEAVDGILPNCGEGGMEILINQEQEENQDYDEYDYQDNGQQFFISDSTYTTTGLLLNDLRQNIILYKTFCLDRYINETGQWTGTLARICKSSILTDEEVCKKRTCIQHCCPYGDYLDSATNDCVPATLPESLLPLNDNGTYDYDYQFSENEKWFDNWNNETHKKVPNVKGDERPKPIFGNIKGTLNCSSGQSVFKWDAYDWSIDQNGVLNFDGSTIPVGKSCVNRERIDKTTNVDQVLVCTEDFCKDHSCIPHCCPAGQYFSGIDSRCIKDSKLKNSLWTEETKLKVKNPKKGQPIPTFIDARTFSCKLTTGNTTIDKYTINSLTEYDFGIKSNGDLSVDGATVPFGRYCVNLKPPSQDQENFTEEVHFCTTYRSCDSDYEKWKATVDNKLIPSLFVISMIFLGFLVVHTWQQEKEKLFGWLKLSTILMLFIFYMFQSIIKFSDKGDCKRGTIKPFNQGSCLFIGLVIQYSYLSSVFWLTSMSYFMWKMFRSIQVQMPQRPYRFGCQIPAFKWYALFCWGTPFLMIIVTLVMQHLEECQKDEPTLICPKLDKGCFLDSTGAKWLYFDGINTPMFIVNCGFFAHFMYNMFYGVWAKKSGDPKVAKEKEQQLKKLHVCIKLFFVMGITWIADIISKIIISGGDLKDNDTKEATIFFQVINSLQGFFMFCLIYFESARLKRIWNRVKTCKGQQVQPAKETDAKCNKTRNSSVQMTTL